MDRTCETCGMVFSYPSRLRRHLERATPCRAAHSCEGCGKEYENRNSLWRHKQSCAERAANINNAEGVFNVNGVEADQANINNGQHQGDNIGRDKNININIFTKEDLSHITPEKIRAIVEKSAGSTEALVSWLMKEIYCRDENRNAYMKEKETMAMVLGEGPGDEPTWSEVMPEILYPPMVDKAANSFFDQTHEVPCLPGTTMAMMGRVQHLCEELDKICPKDEGPKPILLKSTSKMGRSILIANGKQLEELGII